MNIEKSILDELIGIIDTDLAIVNCGYIFLQLHTSTVATLYCM